MEVELSAEKFFMTVNLFGLVEYATCDLLPTGLYMFAEGYASLKRIQVSYAENFRLNNNHQVSFQDFLCDEELNDIKSKKSLIPHNHNTLLDQTALQITNLSCCWNKNQISATIANLTASFKEGNLNAIIGPVGCGKVDIFVIDLPQPNG